MRTETAKRLLDTSTSVPSADPLIGAMSHFYILLPVSGVLSFARFLSTPAMTHEGVLTLRKRLVPVVTDRLDTEFLNGESHDCFKGHSSRRDVVSAEAVRSERTMWIDDAVLDVQVRILPLTRVRRLRCPMK